MTDATAIPPNRDSDGAATDHHADVGPRQARRRRRNDRLGFGTRHRFALDVEALGFEDGRRKTVRRIRDIASAIAQDHGGSDPCSAVKAELIKRFASIAVLAEAEEARFAAGEEPDVERLALVASTLCRLASRIGLDRLPREIEPLNSYLEQRYGQGDAAEPESEGDPA
jgi:hypothetical protein